MGRLQVIAKYGLQQADSVMLVVDGTQKHTFYGKDSFNDVLASGAAKEACVVKRIRDGTMSLSVVGNNKNWEAYQVRDGRPGTVPQEAGTDPTDTTVLLLQDLPLAVDDAGWVSSNRTFLMGQIGEKGATVPMLQAHVSVAAAMLLAVSQGKLPADEQLIAKLAATGLGRLYQVFNTTEG